LDHVPNGIITILDIGFIHDGVGQESAFRCRPAKEARLVLGNPNSEVVTRFRLCRCTKDRAAGLRHVRQERYLGSPRVGLKLVKHLGHRLV
jgi:hypothetical protein